MKNTMIKSFLALVIAFMALPMMGQNYLKIYFKDGHTERHFMHLVNNIAMTKYDLEGNLHSDYQMQQIVMPDTTYSYYLADIDSMTFRKVDEEQIKRRLASVQSSLESIFQECSSLEDLASHIDEIRSIDGVEYAYSEGKNLVIQILDWYEICIDHQPLPVNLVSSPKLMPEKNIKRFIPTKQEKSQLTATIGFQMDKDKTWAKEKGTIESLWEDFDYMGYQPKLYLGEELDFDFFYNRMFDSNLLLIDTHGGRGIFNKKHYLYTGIETEHLWSSAVGLEVLQGLGINIGSIDLDDIGITCCEHSEGGIILGVKWYWMVKEDFIRKSPNRFTGAGPHIVFIAACSSLEGDDILTRSDGVQPYGSDSFAKVFFEKGADVYLGYNRGSNLGSGASACYFDLLMHGASAEKAFSTLDPLYKHETHTTEKALLVDLYNQNKNYAPKRIFIVNTNTVEKTDQEFSIEYQKNGFLELVGGTTRSSQNHNTDDETYYNFLYFGFVIATHPNVDNLTNDDTLTSSNAHYIEGNSKEIVFSTKFIPIPGVTYYYRAFTWDGTHYNWGEEKSFTINQLTVSTNYLSLEAGWTRTVDITSGSGSYVIESDDEFVATAFVDGNTISINALNPGDATITVSDKVSGQTQTIKVTVTGQADTRELMVTKTVNKTVYSLYKKTLDENNYRTNPDGWRCYRSELVLDIIKDGRTESYVIDNNIYLDKKNNHHTGQHPCLLLDFNKNMIGVFCSSKESGSNYDMDGYYYSSSMSNISFSKETVFEGYNWGWFPYFRDYGDDNINLCNFSYDGYFTILAVRTSGSWDLYYDNKDISPDAAQQIWERIGSVLVIGKNQDDEVDDRIHALIPDEIRDVIDEYIPIYDGMNPPNIEGSYYLSPQILIGSSLSYDQIGKEYNSEYQKYGNQDMVNNTIDMVRVSVSETDWSKGSGAFISGTGNNFTIFFDQTGESYETNEAGESYTIPYKWVYIVSGTKTANGIKDLTVGFVMKEKGYDPEEKIVDVGTFRFFTDPDGISQATSWPYGNQYGTKKRVKQGSTLPSILNNNRKKLTPLK